jgi:Lamin Tail Domain
MKRVALSTVAACLLGACLLAPAAQATGRGAGPLASPLRFTYIQYDSPGNDLPPTNAKLNAEFVTIHNPTSIARPLTGFRVHDLGPDHTYHFGTFRLGSQKSVRLHTGKGTNTATNRYWGLDYYVWNNDGDTAFLVSNLGVGVDSCHWNGGATGIHC